MASVNSDVVCKDDWDNAHHSNKLDFLPHKLQNLRENLDMKIGILEIERVIGITESQNKLDKYKETLKHFSIDVKNRRYNCYNNRNNAHHSIVDWLSDKSHINWIAYHELNNLFDFIHIEMCILEIDQVITSADSQDKFNKYKSIFVKTKKKLESLIAENNNLCQQCSKKTV
nr:9254_t:CDS:2 [Entrophospora candida]